MPIAAFRIPRTASPNHRTTIHDIPRAQVHEQLTTEFLRAIEALRARLRYRPCRRFVQSLDDETQGLGENANDPQAND